MASSENVPAADRAWTPLVPPNPPASPAAGNRPHQQLLDAYAVPPPWRASVTFRSLSTATPRDGVYRDRALVYFGDIDLAVTVRGSRIAEIQDYPARAAELPKPGVR
jgi:hypothetical protein